MQEPNVPEPNWLTPQEMAFWKAFIATASSVIVQVDQALKADSGLTFDDYEVLVQLSEADDNRIRMNELSQTLQQSPSRLTQRIDRMADRGLVQREKCPSDKRGTYATITGAGMAAIEAAAPDHLRTVRAVLIDQLSPAQLEAGRDLFETAMAAATSPV